MKRLFCAALLLLVACQPSPREKAKPALWEVRGAKGEKGWLMGTVHALPAPVDWRSAQINTALAASDELLLEISNADDPTALGKMLDALSHSAGQPPFADRVKTSLRTKLAVMLAQYDLQHETPDTLETWAFALSLSRAIQAESKSSFGLEFELMQAAKGKVIGELEGASAQFRVFDTLPEADQRDLLNAVVSGADDNNDTLTTAWKRGDMDVLAAETHKGLLADAELREALLLKRNRDWVGKIAAKLNAGKHPFVALGAAHMAGEDGLPAMLAASGFTVTRIQ